MGNWNINIQGTGAHHNEDNSGDADKMVRQFVVELQKAGHDIEHATLTFGSKEVYAGPDQSVYGWIRPRAEVAVPPNGSGKVHAFSMDDLTEIEQGNPFKYWTNEYFAKLLASNRTILNELETLKADPAIRAILDSKKTK